MTWDQAVLEDQVLAAETLEENSEQDSQQNDSQIEEWVSTESEDLALAWAWDTEQVPVKNPAERFKAENCNRYRALAQCIISKAPVENQAIMQEKLEEKLQVWDHLSSPDQYQICKEVLEHEQTIKVLEHYQNQGCKI